MCATDSELWPLSLKLAAFQSEKNMVQIKADVHSENNGVMQNSPFLDLFRSYTHTTVSFPNLMKVEFHM